MNKSSSLLTAAAAGALAAYLFDPQRGRSRRARVREAIGGRLSHADELGASVATDLTNRVKGTFAQMRARFSPIPVPDEIVAERVRAKLGRFLSHPGAVEVSARDGAVTLRGPVLNHEAERALRAVRRVPGVRHTIDALQRHQQQGNVSSLQGGRSRAQRIDIMQQRWSPATRVVAGTGGALVAACALARRSPLALLAGAAGAALSVRAATNMDARRLLGQRGRRAMTRLKTYFEARKIAHDTARARA